MWLRKGEQVVLVPGHMPDTITRCLDEGWVEIPDPRIQGAGGIVSAHAGMPIVGEPAPEMVVLPASTSKPETQPQPHVRHQKGRR